MRRHNRARRSRNGGPQMRFNRTARGASAAPNASIAPDSSAARGARASRAALCTSSRFARGTALLLALVSAIVLLAGCTPKASGQTPDVSVNPVPSTSYVDLVLYFGDDQAMEVLPERRRVEVPADPAQRESIPTLIVRELLKGPQDPLLSKTLPPEAKLLSLEAANGIAYVNFSKEIQTKHWGGSAGESMSILSLVSSLTQAEPLTSSSAIQKVQILVEGKTVESLAGHAYTSRPMGPAIRTDVPFFTSQERAAALQKRVDEGQDAFRKDPLAVAKFEAPARGFHPALSYTLASKQGGKATVTVKTMVRVTVQAGKIGEGTVVETKSEDIVYTISLIQPVKKGEGGVWVISEIAKK